MDDLDPTAMEMFLQTDLDTKIKRSNLRRAYQLSLVGVWTPENRERLYAACFTEWGPRWRSRISEESA